MNLLPILIVAGIGAFGIASASKKKKPKRKTAEPFSYSQPHFGVDEQGNTVVVFDTEWLTLEAEPFLRGWAEASEGGLDSLTGNAANMKKGDEKWYDVDDWQTSVALSALLAEHAPDIQMVLDAPDTFDNPGAIAAAQKFAHDLNISVVRSALLALGHLGISGDWPNSLRPDASPQSFVLVWSTVEYPVEPVVKFTKGLKAVITGTSYFFVEVTVDVLRSFAIANGMSHTSDEQAMAAWFQSNVDFKNDPPLLVAHLNEGAAAVPVYVASDNDAAVLAAMSAVSRNSDTGIQVMPVQLTDFEPGDPGYMALVSVDSPVMAVSLARNEPVEILLSFNVASGKLNPVEINVALAR